MAIQYTTSRRPKSRVTALIGFGLLLVRGNPIDAAATRLCHLICALTGELFKFAPSIILAGCRALESCFFAHHEFLQCVQSLLPVWQLLHFIFGAA
jgi:hypothetical protein